MDDQVSWLLEMTVKPGELDNLKALIKEMVESTRAEPGALNYQWCISDNKHHRSQL
jgi:quinol monooxygenase YgiN